MPSAPVTAVAGVTVPPPRMGSKRTVCCGTGLPKRSTTSAPSDSSTSSPASATWLLPTEARISAGGPGSAVASMVAGARLPTVTIRVFRPLRVPSVHCPTLVGPLAVRVGGFRSVPPPSPTAMVTAMPPRAFPLASRTTKVGGESSALPASAEGRVVVAASMAFGTGAGPPPSLQAAVTIARAKSARQMARGRTTCDMRDEIRTAVHRTSTGWAS